MIHKIDLRDHGLFSSKGFHPLTHLTIPESLYRLMTYDSGKPNRKLINYYRQKMIDLGYDAKILISHIVSSEGEILPHKEAVIYGIDYFDYTISLIKNIRPHLMDEFKNMRDDELMVDGIFLTAKKPTG